MFDDLDIAKMQKNYDDLKLDDTHKGGLIKNVGFFVNRQNPLIFFDTGTFFNLYTNEYIFKGNSKTQLLATYGLVSPSAQYIKILDRDSVILVIDKQGNTKQTVDIYKLFNSKKINEMAEENKDLFRDIINAAVFLTLNVVMIPQIETYEENMVLFSKYNINSNKFGETLYYLKPINLKSKTLLQSEFCGDEEDKIKETFKVFDLVH